MIDLTELLNTISSEIQDTLAITDSRALEDFRALILQASRIFVSGKGRSGLQMRGFAMRLMHLGLQVHVVDDVTTPAIKDGDLLILGSGSGNTRSLVNYALKAREVGAKIALITISNTSTLKEMADNVVYVDAPTPKAEVGTARTSIMPMGSLFEFSMGILLEIVLIQLMNQLGMTSDSMFERHANLE